MPGSTFRWLYAACRSCGAQSGEVRIDTLSEWREQAEDDARQRAIEEWNTRAPSEKDKTQLPTTEGESTHD
jgi:hypothetical protein